MTEKPLTYLIRKTKPTIKENLSGIGIRFKVYKDEKEVLEIKSVWNAWEVEYNDVLYQIKGNIWGTKLKIFKKPYLIGDITFNYKLTGAITFKDKTDKEHDFLFKRKYDSWFRNKRFEVSDENNKLILTMRTKYEKWYSSYFYEIEFKKDFTGGLDANELIIYCFACIRQYHTMGEL